MHTDIRPSPTRHRAGWWFYVLLAGAVLVTALAHEFAHAATGEALGHAMVMSLNNAHPVSGALPPAHATLVTAAGPLVTVLQGIVACALVLRTGALAWYAPLFAATFMRFAAMVVSVVHPNDEARLSMALGLGTWTIPALTVAAMTGLAVVASRRLRLHWSVQALAYLVASVAVAAIVGLDAAR
jgi:hypothetical protein